MKVLQGKRLLSFAADTFLHFAIYSAFFLWSLCGPSRGGMLDAGDVHRIIKLIEDAAAALETASLYAGDSPALHAKFLRNLATNVTYEAKPPEKFTISSLLDAAQPPLSAGDQTYPYQPFANNVPSLASAPIADYRVADLDSIAQRSDPSAWLPSAFDPALTVDLSEVTSQFPWLEEYSARFV